MIFARYASRFGPLGNFFFGMKRVQGLIGSQVNSIGWFRRGIAPWLDLAELNANGTVVKSYPRFWSLFLAVVLTGIGTFLLLGSF